jgi:hypothetical protein
MKELTFKLSTNDEVIMDVKTTYFMKEDVINFTIDDNIYRFNITKCILNKENKESMMNIDMLNKMIIYLYKDLNKEFQLPIDNNKLSNNDNYVKFEYEIPDNDIVNIIEISY